MPSSADAHVIVKVDVRDEEASRKLKGLVAKFAVIEEAYNKANRAQVNHLNKLTSALEAQDKHLSKLNETNKAQTEHYKDLNKEVDQYKKTVNDSNSVIGKASGRAKRLTQDLVSLDKELQNKHKDFDKLSNVVSKSEGKMKSAGKSALSFKDVFGKLGKFLKLAGTEFAVMAGAVGALKLVLVAGQYAAKGFNASMRALGVGAGWAAGAVTAAVGTALAAIRQLNVAKITPVMQAGGQSVTGANSIASQVSGLMGSRDLGMFSTQALTGIASEAARSGQGVDAQFMELTKTLGNFAIVAKDPNKALTDLVSQFMLAKKEGKVTSDIFKEIAEASPDLKKGFEEVYGGADGLQKALASGKVSFDEVLTAFNEGRVNSLLPFADALDNVNNTLIGKFKGSLRSVTEQLTQLGGPLLETLVGPLDALERKIRVFLMRVTPTIQSVFTNLIPADGGSLMGRFFDSMAMAVNEHLPKLIGFIDRVVGKWREFSSGWKDFFGKAETYLQGMTTSWDSIWNNVLKPIGTEFVKTVEHAIKAFNGLIGDNQGGMEQFSSTIHSIGEAIRSLIDGLTELKKIMAPLISAFMQMIQMLSTVLEIPGMGLVGATLGMGAMLGRTGNRKANPNGRRGAKGGGMRGMMNGVLSMATFPFMGLPGRLTNDAQAGPMYGPPAPAQSRLMSMRRAGRDFFQAGVKPFMKGIGPSIAPMLLSYAGGMVSSGGSAASTGRQGLGGALSGAGQGAMIGATIGSVVPGVGTAIGAGVGAAVMGLTGLISGRSAAEDERQRRKQESVTIAQQLAFEGLDPNSRRSVMNRYSQYQQYASAGTRTPIEDRAKELQGQIQDYFGENSDLVREIDDIYGDLVRDEDLNKLLSDQKKLAEFYADDRIETSIREKVMTLKKNKAEVSEIKEFFTELGVEYIDDFAGAWDEANQKLQDMASNQEKNFKYMDAAFGLTSDQVESLANKVGGNLSEGILSLGQIMDGLGYQVTDLGIVMDTAANRAMAAGKALDIILAPIESRKAAVESEARLKAAGEAAFDYTGGNKEELQTLMGDYMSLFWEGELTKLQTGEYGSMDEMLTGALGIFSSQHRAGSAYVQGTGFGRENLGVAKDIFMEGYNALRGQMGVFGSRMQLDPAFANEFGMKLLEIVKAPGFGAMSPADQVSTGSKQLQEFLDQKGVQVDTTTLEGLILGELQSGAATMKDSVKQGVIEGINQASIRLQLQIPNALGLNLPKDGGGDTASERWQRTASKHSAFDSTVSGSRTITSGVRSNNLGSMLSDHKTGRAYDLTGDNLGQYASAIKGAGGFAEFHGSAGSRHLHVVPPQGDTSSPVKVGSMGGSSNNYAIYVTSASSDPEAVADVVMARIQRAERTNRERQ
jgi:hypothetical protein